MKNAAIAAGAALVLGAAAYANYRRFVPKPMALGGTKYPVQTRDLTVDAGEHSLFGQLLVPCGIDGKLPTVIVSHGLNSNGKNAKALIGESLAISGFQVYCFDFYGGSIRSASGGKMWNMTVFTEKADLEAVIAKIKTLDTTDGERLFLLGESQGGFVTAITAAEHPEIKAVIEYYPALCIPEDARKRHGAKESIPVRENFGGSLLGRAYSESVWDYDVYCVIPAYKGPVLIIHGDNDKAVNISYGRKAAEVYEHAEFVCLPGEIHGFTGEGRKKAAQLSYDFLQRALSGDDREEILTIHVTITGSTMKHEGIYNIMTVPFTGTAKSKWFSGTILPGAADVQRRKLWKIDRFCADYTLEGTDYTGEKCRVHIVNVDEGQGWKPTVTTDSKALSFLNGADCKAVLQGHKDQLTVRIFAKPDHTRGEK
ncbi:MAG: alpha/beta fold hydrolase [Clostridia bacterium]|nr:alpha/beta fold hydrolase [Clostridia bacterium]